jgi:hypothetical protein
MTLIGNFRFFKLRSSFLHDTELQELAYEDDKLAVLVAGLLKIAQSHPDQFDTSVRQFIELLYWQRA